MVNARMLKSLTCKRENAFYGKSFRTVTYKKKCDKEREHHLSNSITFIHYCTRMLHYFLAALLLAAAAQGYRQFELEESPSDEPTTPDPPVDDTEMETKVTVMESPSNVTFKEAARYLPMGQRVRCANKLFVCMS